MTTTTPTPNKNVPSNHFDLKDVQENVEQAGKEMARSARHAQRAVTRAAQDNPVIAAATLLGVGAVLGALVYRLISPPQTPGQVLLKALKQGAQSTGHTLLNGFAAGRRMVS